MGPHRGAVQDELLLVEFESGEITRLLQHKHLFAPAHGWVSGEIRVPNVVINGNVEGDIYSTHKIEMAPLAVVRGNVYYKVIEMQLGAVVDGVLMHEQSAEDARSRNGAEAEDGSADS